MIYQNRPCLAYFSAVVKNVANPNIEIKKLVYIYILHFAESEPDLALLSINAIQKSLSDPNAQVRSMALRVMSGIRVPVISQIVSLAIKKGCADMSPHVRKTAALAIPKCYNLDPGTLPQLLDYISILLGDQQYFVAGSAVSAFLEVCPDRLDLIHKHYRDLVRKLVDMDEWGQLAVIKLMTYYSRKCFARATIEKHSTTADDSGMQQYDKGQEENLDPDLELFLENCKSLLNSRNAAVVVAVARSFMHLAPVRYLGFAVAPLISLLRAPQSIEQLVLYNIVAVCLLRPRSFLPYFSHFLIRAVDAPEVIKLKLELLTLIFPEADNEIQGLVLNELEHFTKAETPELVRESVRAIGRCALSSKATSSRCMNLLLRQASGSDGTLVAEALTVVRHLIQQDPSSHTKTIIRLAKNLDSMTNPDARAGIVWLVGEYSNPEQSQDVAPDVLRILLQSFAEEAEPVKLQIVLLAAKVYLAHLNSANLDESTLTSTADDMQDQEKSINSDHPITVLWNYTLLLARYDVSYDLRDRARLYKALLENTSSIELANLILRAPKPPPHASSPSEVRKGFLLGSASLVVGIDAGLSGLHGYEPLPDWVLPGQEPDAALRNQDDGYTAANPKTGVHLTNTTAGSAKADRPLSSTLTKGRTLDDWLAEDNEKVQFVTEEEEDGSEEEEEEDESEESDSSEEESDEDEEDEEDEKDKLLDRIDGH